MPTISDIRAAERTAQLQRLENARLLRIDETKAQGGDLDLANRVLAAAKGDGAAFDRAIADRKVADLFRCGVLFFASTQTQGT